MLTGGEAEDNQQDDGFVREPGVMATRYPLVSQGERSFSATWESEERVHPTTVEG